MPQWRIYSDVYLNIPYPAWYLRYLLLHPHLHRKREDGTIFDPLLNRLYGEDGEDQEIRAFPPRQGEGEGEGEGIGEHLFPRRQVGRNMGKAGGGLSFLRAHGQAEGGAVIPQSTCSCTSACRSRRPPFTPPPPRDHLPPPPTCCCCCCRLATRSRAEEDGTAHLQWLARPSPPGARVAVTNPFGPQGPLEPLLEEPWVVELVGDNNVEVLCGCRYAGDADVAAAGGGARYRPSYSALEPSGLVRAEWVGAEEEAELAAAAAAAGERGREREAAWDALRGGGGRDLKTEPMSPGEAEMLLRAMLGKNFDRVMEQVRWCGSGSRSGSGGDRINHPPPPCDVPSACFPVRAA